MNPQVQAVSGSIQFITTQMAVISAQVRTFEINTFTWLMIIDFAFLCSLYALRNTDTQTFAAAIVQKLLAFGFYAAVLFNGSTWANWIIQSLQLIGATAAGLPNGIAPDAVMARGYNIAVGLWHAMSVYGLFVNTGACLACLLAGALIFFSFVLITLQYIQTLIEAAITLNAAQIFLAFGGSRWTVPYVERYFSLAVSLGVRIMCLYILIGLGMSLSASWAPVTATIGTNPEPAGTAFSIAGGSIIFLGLAWMSPKWFASILGGTAHMSHSDLVAPVTAVAGMAFGTAAVASGVGAAAYGSIRSAASAAGAGIKRITSSGAGAAASAAGAGAGSSGAGSTGGTGGAPRSSPPRAAARIARTAARIRSVINHSNGPDSGSSPSPPRTPLGH